MSKYPKICKICRFRVNQDSKHCRQCNRCVDGFDHHCKWLNNCIGKQNYLQFAWLIGALQMMAVLECCCAGLVVYWIETKADIGPIYQLESQEARIVFECFIIGCGLCSFIVFLAVSQLVLFHVWLKYKNLTTYQYIVLSRQLKVSSRQNDNQLNAEDSVKVQFEPYIVLNRPIEKESELIV